MQLFHEEQMQGRVRRAMWGSTFRARDLTNKLVQTFRTCRKVSGSDLNTHDGKDNEPSDTIYSGNAFFGVLSQRMKT